LGGPTFNIKEKLQVQYVTEVVLPPKAPPKGFEKAKAKPAKGKIKPKITNIETSFIV